MNERTFEVLDFENIKNRLGGLAETETGRRFVSGIFPFTEKDKVQKLLDETDEAVTLLVKKGNPPLGSVTDIVPSLVRATAGGCLNFTELLNAAGLLRTSRRLIAFYPEDEKREDREQEDKKVQQVQRPLKKYFETLQGDRVIEDRIFGSILSDDEMADEASPELGSIRRHIRDKQNTVREKLSQIIRSSKYSKVLQEPVITLRDDRYCVPVKIECRGDIPGIVHDTSSSGQTLFIEPAFAVEANNEVRELKIKEQNEIRRITEELSLAVAGLNHMLRQDQKAVAYIDFTFAKAHLALEMKSFKPQINDRGYINIKGGRHPLIDKNKVVPTDIFIGDSFRSLIITGPNTGGKTVTLKTVGLFTLMTQCGLLIPAKEGSEMAVFKGIYADIGDEQSISQNLSTFSGHMKNISEIISKADSESLVLFDELGAGTDPAEGAALAMAILEAFYQMGAITIATTHYSEIKVFASTTKGFENACCEFDVSTLSPTYRLLIGIPGKSNAFAIAARTGLDPAIAERAKEFLTGEDIRFEDMLLGIEKSRNAIEADRAESERLKKESERLKEEIKTEREDLEARRNELIAKSRKEAEKVLKDARAEADKLLTEIRKAAFEGGGKNTKAAEEASQKLNELRRETVGKYGEKEVKASDSMENASVLTPGTDVFIAGIESNGTILKEPDSDGKVYVQVGIIKTYVDRNDVKVLKTKQEKTETKYGQVKKSDMSAIKGASIRTELDLRGYTQEDALATLEKYMDDAVMARLKTFYVIHGKGTGALRTCVQQYLKRDKRVDKFRLGEYGEGDAGVTVVYLR